MKLNVTAFGLTCGLIWGLGLFCLTWWIIYFEPDAHGRTTTIGLIYRGYTVSAVGSLIGLAWAFVDGLVGGIVFAWLYNLLVTRLAKPIPAAA